MSQTLPIRPDILAGKFAAAANLTQPRVADALAKEPRWREVLCWLQSLSHQPGGLDKFAADLVNTYSSRLGPQCLLAIAGELTGEQCLAIWHQMPKADSYKLSPDSAWKIGIETELDGTHFSPDMTGEERTALEKILAQLNRATFHQAAVKAANERLASYLASLCNEVDNALESPPWYFADIKAVLFAAMENHARTATGRIAMTEVALKVFDALDYAWSEKIPVRIEGDSRFGKTEALKTYCAMRPGRVRLVTCPCTNCDADLYRAVADAVGLEHGPRTNARELKDNVEYIIRHSGLMFIFDEAHFLLPTRFNANTVPFRLNWIRTRFIDIGVPIAIVNTPQAYGHAVSKFLKKTGYNFDQFLGRIMHHVVLPNELEMSDLMAVAKIHFPELSHAMLQLIAAKALQSESYLMAVEAIARRARHVAKRDGHPAITVADLQLAIAETIPGTTAPVVSSKASARETAAPKPATVRPRNTRLAAPAPGPTTAPAPLRSKRPAASAPELEAAPASREISPRPFVENLIPT